MHRDNGTRLLGEGLLPKNDLLRILNEATKMLGQLPNLARIQEPVFVIADQQLDHSINRHQV